MKRRSAEGPPRCRPEQSSLQARPAATHHHFSHHDDVSRTLAGGRSSEAHGHETDHSDKRARKHGSGSMAPRIAGSLYPAPPLLHLDHHDLDGDDRVVNQKTQTEDQSAERDAIKYSSGQKHDDKDGCQRQGNGRCHNDPYAPTEAEDANEHHHGKSDKELQHEL